MSICAMPTPACGLFSSWDIEALMAYLELIGLLIIFVGIAVIVIRSQ